MSILDDILASKAREICERKSITSVGMLCGTPLFKRTAHSLKTILAELDRPGIIAEFKRRSPSKGWINRDACAEYVTSGYSKAGAAGVSILTDGAFFGGSPDDVTRSRSSVKCPILRKDFIIDEYQIFEAKAMGADVVLLIAAALSDSQIRNLVARSHDIGLEVLFEVHSELELRRVVPDIDIIGVNNRDLKSFRTDISMSLELAGLIPEGLVKISESGISDPDTIKSLYNVGYKGFLMGESFMKEQDPSAALVKILDQI